MYRKWTIEEINFLKNKYLEIGCQECSKVLNRSELSIKSEAIKLKLFFNKWTESENKILLDNYGKITSKEIMKLLKNRSYKSITMRAKRMNLKSNRSLLFQLKERKNKFNENFFENINTLNSYWAGFIAADGNVYKNRITIRLSSLDRDHLIKLKNDLNFEGDIKYSNNKKYSGIYFFSKKTKNDIKNNFNIIPKKSLILEPPFIEDENCLISFICGLLDGDGSIYYKNDKIYMKFLGTKKILDWVKNVLSKYIDIDKNSVNESGKIYSLEIHKKDSVLKIFNLVQKYNLPLLDRKWEKLKNYL